MPNVELQRLSRPSMWRRMALVCWGRPQDPQIFARMEVDMKEALAYADRETKQAGVRITPTHLVMRAAALCLKQYPDANAIVRWRRIYTRKRIHLFCHVAIPGKKADLSGIIIRDAETKDCLAIARELDEKVRAVRRGTDPEYAKTRKRLDSIPGFLYGICLRLIGFCQYTLNRDLSFLGFPKDPFGGLLVTSVGSLGIAEAFAPLSPITRAPIVVAVGKVEEKPVVRDGQIVIRPVCVLCATFDHRVMDGLLAGKLAKFVGRYLADPERYEARALERNHGARPSESADS